MFEQTIAPPAVETSHVIVARQMLTLHQISWQQYVTITDALPNRTDLRTSYDGKSLELMTTSHIHEWFKKTLGRLFEMLTFELDIDIHPGGETTFRREDLERGLEPDQCYWVGNEAHMRPLHDWDPKCDPAPDFAIEIDVSHSSVDRESIYAQLGTEEIWRYDGSGIRVLHLLDSGTYELLTESLVIPGLDVAALLPFLRRMQSERENQVLRDFVEWIHETLR